MAVKIGQPAKQKKGPKVEFTPEHQRDFDGMMEKCYQGLHKPMVVKVGEFRDKIWYICQDCLDAYMKDHPELKPLIVAFRR